MRFKIGHKLKPHEVKKNGVVLFTDGTRDDLLANQFTCEAYGYHFIDGVCCAFTPSPELMENKNVNTYIDNGHNNEPNVAHSTIVNGSHHTVQQSYGCLVTGESHTIAPLTPNDDADAEEFYVNNSAIIGGSYGHVSQSGQVVIAGGKGDGAGLKNGMNQMSIYSLAAAQTTSGDINMVIQGDTDRAAEIYLPPSSINIFEIHLSGLCIGGSSGTVGHHKTLVQTGTCIVSSNSEISNTFDAGTTTTTSSSGTTGTVSIDTSTYSLLRIKIAGTANVSVNWYAVVKIYTNKTRVNI
tara:strand:- start:237 stop:1124 length:888 start_codon:yes stop_codon:yes gene_type:complete